MCVAIFAARLFPVLIAVCLVGGVQPDQSKGHEIKVNLPEKWINNKNDKDDQKLWTAEVSIHLLSLVETINTKLATWDLRFGQMETQMSSLQNHVETTMSSLQNYMDAVEARIMSKINDGESQLTAVEQRLENQVMRLSVDTSSVKDKLSDLEKITSRVLSEDKFISEMYQVKERMAAYENKLQLEIELLKETVRGKPTDNHPSDISVLSIGHELQNFGNFVVDGVNGRLDKLVQSVDVDKRKLLDHFKNVTDGLEETISGASETLYTVSREMSVNLNESLESIEYGIVEDTEKLVLRMKNVTEPVYERIESVTNELMVVKDVVKSSIDKMGELPERVTEIIDAKLSNVSDEMSQVLGDKTGALNASLVTSFNNMRIKIPTDLGSTEGNCKKGMEKYAAQDPFPYPIVYSDIVSIDKKAFLCDTATAGGGWIIIQYRSRGDTDFYRGWEDYKRGFGSLGKDFWIGLDTIYGLASTATYELRIELKYKGHSKFAHYATFSVGSEAEKYKLSVGSYDGTAGDSLSASQSLNGMEFSTKDRDNDEASIHCAVKYTGAWWFKNCHHSGLNGVWGATGWKGPCWYTFTKTEPATFTEMKIRRVDI